LQLKDRLKIKIENMAFGGAGVGRVDSFVIFVPFAAPDDELEIEITECKKRFARGRILKVIKASPLRVQPLCSYYETCGGCCYQHISYEQQLEIKKRQVEEAFRKIGKIAAPPVLETKASPESYHYRGKAQFHLVKSPAVLKLGFRDVSGGEIVDIERCEIMEETINRKICRIRENPLHPDTQDSRLTIWSEAPDGPAAGTKQIFRLVRDKEFLVSRDGFFQNNLFLTGALVDEVCRLALSGPMNTVIDAYCGCGLFSVFLAPFSENIFAIELDEKAIKFAQMNAAKENIKNVTFVRGDVGEELSREKIKLQPDSIDLLILDPPRAGCSESVLKAITRLRPRRLIYISCNPVTQARDMKFLNESGYDIVSLRPFDMFPQTQHIEIIGLLEFCSERIPLSLLWGKRANTR
jgi:tRNA/tmRNA/rRNA uracil-C5-methylase (TrmA/RlmC/RlmD family)